MKNDSTKIICEVALRAYRQSEDARELNDERSRLDWLFVHEKLMQVLRAEQPATTTKFDIWKWVYKDETLRPAMCGIFHEDGYKVASESRILVWLKEDYAENLEGRILYKDGRVLDCYKYPRWRDVIPTSNTQVVKIDIAKFREAYNDWKARMKAFKRNATDDDPGKGVVKVANTYFLMDLFGKVVDFMDAFGVDEIICNEENNLRSCMVKAGESGCLIMPIVGKNEAGQEVKVDVEFKA